MGIKALNRGLENPASRESWVLNTKTTAIKEAAKHGVDSALVKKIWGDLDDEFFLKESADDIARYT
ncbi:MAG: hypothetical protein MUQ34_01635, partial [Flavobacteriaceae bacterium]|nr:hypothetical protein [Flavobacteriaceae bacterium]